MDPTNPKECDALDLRPVMKSVYPSYGPSWDQAIEMGIDVGQLEANLVLSPHERLMQLHEMNRTYELIRAASPKHP